MSRRRIEEIAVNRLKDLIMKSQILEPYIDSNDKTPSWDGNIFVYSTSTNSKKDLVGKIPVQVKGKTVKKFSKESIKYPFEVADLNNYLRDGGVLIFVVETKDVDDVKIYYSSLLPIDIKYILRIYQDKEQKSISINLNLLDNNESSKLEIICKNFLLNRERQFSTYRFSKGIDDFEKFNILEFKIIPGEISPENYILENDIYLYGKENQDSVPVPISKIKIDNITHDMNREVYVGQVKYFENYTVTRTNNDLFITFGKHINFYLNKGIINYKIAGSLKERIKLMEFFIALIKYNDFKIGDVLIKRKELNIIEEKESMINYLNYLYDINTLLNFFQINQDIDMDNFKKKDYDNLKLLIETIIYNKKIKLKGENNGIKYIHIGNLKILLLITVDENGFISLENFFNLTKKYTYILTNKKTNEKFETSKYIVMKAKDFIEASNLNLATIEKSIKSFTLNNNYCDFLTLFLLELIKAYDQNNSLINCLSLASELCEWLENYDNNSPIHKINRYQILIRKKPLSIMEKEEIIEIRKKSADDIEILCAISILLYSRTDFEFYFEKLSKKKKKLFSEYPIYKLISNF